MKNAVKAARMKQSVGDRVFLGVSNLFLILLVIVILYPVYFVVIASVTEPALANNGSLLLYPKGFNLLGYKRILTTQKSGSDMAIPLFIQCWERHWGSAAWSWRATRFPGRICRDD